MLVLSRSQLEMLNEIVGGRFDALQELAENEKIPNRKQLLREIEELRPLVEKIRAANA